MSNLLLRGVELDGHRLADVRIANGRVSAIAPTLARRPGEETIDGRRGALVPGLRDHHCHLLATAAALVSVDLEGASTARAVVRRLREASLGGDGWLRATGFDDAACRLDREILDHWHLPGPTRVQHHGGALWILDSAALAAIGVVDGYNAGKEPPGLERDDTGRATGRLWRADSWLRTRLPTSGQPDLAAVGQRLRAAGVTGVTDATPKLDDEAAKILLHAVGDGRLPPALQLLGRDDLPDSAPPRVRIGPRKVILDDRALPSLDALVDDLRAARSSWHGSGRPIAVHCVTREAAALLLAALRVVGVVAGDRVEHAAELADGLLPEIRRLRLTVVTQPAMAARRGDRYLSRIEPTDRDDLWRLGSLADHDVPVGLSSDAPHGPLDPWEGIRAAVHRRTPDGSILGEQERVQAAWALERMLAPLSSPGGVARRVRVGSPADVVLLRTPLAGVLDDPTVEQVRSTLTPPR